MWRRTATRLGALREAAAHLKLPAAAAALAATAVLNPPARADEPTTPTKTLWCWGALPPAADDAPVSAVERSPVPVDFWATRGVTLTQMVHGTDYAAALDSDGQVWTWSASTGPTPRKLPLPRSQAVELAGTGSVLYAVTRSGALLQWSDVGNSQQQAESPRTLGGALGNVASVSAGCAHVLVRTRQGELFAFGDNSHGQLGLGASADELPALGPEAARRVEGLPAGARVAQMACGQAHSLVVLEDGKCYAWGDDRNLQLGVRGDSVKELKSGAKSQSVPTRTTALEMALNLEGRVRFVAAGGGGIDGGHTVFVVERDNADEVWVCGHGRWGQLGLKSFAHISAPRRVTQLAKLREWDEEANRVRNIGVRKVACGDAHTAVLLDSGNVFLFGWNDRGQLGSGGSQGSHTPAMLKAPQDLRVSNLRGLACGPAATAVWV